MKRIIYLLPILLVAQCIFLSTVSCSEDMGDLGESTRPMTDGITIKAKTFNVNTYTGYRDSVYVRTGYPLVGNITDPDFGQVTAGYLAQFYTSSKMGLDVVNAYDSTTFSILRTSAPKEFGYDWSDYHYKSWDSIVGNSIDSMTVRIYYRTYYGDSLTPMQLSVYRLNPKVDFETLPESEFYSNNDFANLYNEDNLIGRKGFTSANRELSDSIRELSDYLPYIEVKLTDDLKDKFYRLCVEAAIARDKSNPHHSEFTDIFTDQKAMREKFLSGVCVKPTFGDGVMIKVYYTAIYFFYSSYHRYDVDGTLLRNSADDGDSTYVVDHVKYMAVTPDVIQMSGYKMVDDNQENRMNNQDTCFITSPQGYYTLIDLPVGEIINTMEDDPLRVPGDSSYFLNASNFYLQAYKPKGSLLSYTPTPTVLMVEKDAMTSFFENGSLPDGSTSCYAKYVCDSVPSSNYPTADGIYYYNFGNINSVIVGLAKKHGWSKEGLNKIPKNLTVPMAIIPVDATTNSQGGVLSVSNYILPTATKLKKGYGKQSLQVLYSVEGTGEKIK